MKRKFKAFFFVFFVFCLLLISVVPSVAIMPSPTSRSFFPPFRMSLVSYVTADLYFLDGTSETYGTSVMCDIPSIFYNNPHSLSEYNYSEFELGNYTLTTGTDFTPQSIGDYTSLFYRISASLYKWDNLDYSETYFSDVTMRFQDGYLSSEYGLYTGGDGLVYASYLDASHDQRMSVSVVGEVVFSGLSLDTYYVEYDTDGILSYYEVLANVNVDYSTIIQFTSDDVRDAWFLELEDLRTLDYSNLTSDQISRLRDHWSYIGPIYGRFDLSRTDLNSMSTDLGYIDYVLTNYSQMESFFLNGLEEAGLNGLTGFERVTKFLGSAVGGFMDLELMPGFHLGSILVVIIAFSIVLWWLKVFAGG